ncbi:hypothetical protein I4U23_012301 [Adineta vaga]|nr:hypothetical protein I4U23_012301 [Adineta vaga]
MLDEQQTNVSNPVFMINIELINKRKIFISTIFPLKLAEVNPMCPLGGQTAGY